MDKKPLVVEQLDAGEKLIRQFTQVFPVQAAFWLRERESDEWYLYLASDQITDGNSRAAYGEVLQIVKPGQSLWINPFQVKVVSADSAVAKAAVNLISKYPGKIPTRYQGRHFGDLSVDEVVIYPLPLPVSA